MIWITADTHFDHDMLWKKGYRPEGFESRIEDAWTNAFRSGDVLLHLGDVSLYPPGTERIKRILGWLRGYGIRTWLIRGNHDHKSIPKYVEEGWDWCGDSMGINYQGRDVLLTHRPEEISTEWQLNIHGHLHNNDHRGDERISDGRHILISQESLDYRPIPLDKVLKLGATPEYHNGTFRKKVYEKNPCA